MKALGILLENDLEKERTIDISDTKEQKHTKVYCSTCAFKKHEYRSGCNYGESKSLKRERFSGGMETIYPLKKNVIDWLIRMGHTQSRHSECDYINEKGNCPFFKKKPAEQVQKEEK